MSSSFRLIYFVSPSLALPTSSDVYIVRAPSFEIVAVRDLSREALKELLSSPNGRFVAMDGGRRASPRFAMAMINGSIDPNAVTHHTALLKLAQKISRPIDSERIGGGWYGLHENEVGTTFSSVSLVGKYGRDHPINACDDAEMLAAVRDGVIAVQRFAHAEEVDASA